MPINAKPEYFKAEAEFHQAETTKDKIKALRNMLSTAPTHKGAEKLRAEIKKKISKLKDISEKEKKSGKGKSLSISKEGASQIVFIGLPNSGKSTLLMELSGKKVKVEPYEFTTKDPEVRMIPYENIWMQGIEIPAIYKGFHDTKQGRQAYALVRNADFVVVVTKDKSQKDLKEIKAELSEANIKTGAKERFREGFTEHLPSLTVTWKDFDKSLIWKIWRKQGKIRVQTKSAGKIAKKPIVMKAGATVEDVVLKIHKDFAKNFRYAKIWGPSAKFAGQQVGFEHRLKDRDIVEVYTK